MHTTATADFDTQDVIELARAGTIALRVDQQTADALEQIYEIGRSYFRLPLTAKLRDRVDDDFGYRPTGIEYSQSPARPDPFESFSASARTAAHEAALPSDEARRLYRQMLCVIDLLEPIAELVARKAAAAFGGSGDALVGALHRWSILQLNYSRPAEVTTSFIHESHEDGHVLTLAASTGPGLELADANGQFVQIQGSRDLLLVMPGEIMWLLSGGRIRPLIHRVVPVPLLQERLALLFFADIDPRQCAPWIANEVNANVDIGGRVLTNAERFGLTGFEEE